MKSILFLTAAGLALAQNFSGQPDCATSCLSSAISAVGCKGEDMGCQCGPTMGIIAATAAPCLIENCGAADLAKANSAGSAQCESYLATAASNSATTTGTETDDATTTGTESGASTTDSATSSAVTTTITDTVTDKETSTGTDDQGNPVTETHTTVHTTTSTSTGGAMGVMATPAIALLGVLGAVAL